MTILCLGALIAGALAATVLPFLPFACAVMAAILIGTVSMVIGRGQVGPTCLSAAALLLASQIGYGLGLIATALVGHAAAVVRRGGTAKKAEPPARPLRTGNEPR